MRGGNRWRVTQFVLAAAMVILAGCGASALPSPTASTTPIPLPTLDASQVAQGRQIYLQNCASCHGQNAEGAANWQQPGARGNMPPPPHDDRGHTWRHSDVQLAEIIRNGLRDPFNKSPELTMPSFEGRLSDEEMRAVTAYFKSLWSSEHRRFQEEQNQRPSMPMSWRGA